MVKYAMGHANYQGLMTGKAILVGITLLDGGAEPTINGSVVSLQMVLFNYLKMEDEYLFLPNYTRPRKLKEYARAEEVSARFGVDSLSASDLSRGIGVSETAEY
jgi:hypothetical protein